MVNDPTEEYLALPEAERRTDAFLQQLEDPALSAHQLQASAETLFAFLSDQLTLLQKLANGYPEVLIRADVWTDGVALAGLGRRLMLAFRERGLTVPEEVATQVWLIATLQVQSHYPHIVGPAMLTGADCQERLGHHAAAAQIYDAMIEDFAWLLDDAEEGTLTDENGFALESLKTALTRRLAGEANPTYEALMARLDALPESVEP